MTTVRLEGGEVWDGCWALMSLKRGKVVCPRGARAESPRAVTGSGHLLSPLTGSVDPLAFAPSPASPGGLGAF